MSQKYTIAIQDHDGNITSREEIDVEGNKLIIIKVGDRDFPATSDMIEKASSIFKDVLKQEGENKVIVWNHAISVEVVNLIDKNNVVPEDVEVKLLCEKWGYGAVMSAASRLWKEKDPSGALSVGPCYGCL